MVPVVRPRPRQEREARRFFTAGLTAEPAAALLPQLPCCEASAYTLCSDLLAQMLDNASDKTDRRYLSLQIEVEKFDYHTIHSHSVLSNNYRTKDGLSPPQRQLHLRVHTHPHAAGKVHYRDEIAVHI